MDVQAAIAKHNHWRSSLLFQISTGDELNVDAISSDSCCAVGKWLYQLGFADRATNDHVHDCIVAHAAFHREAAFVAEMINRERIDDPTPLLHWNGELSRTSKLLVIRLRLLSTRDLKPAGPVMSRATMPQHRRPVRYTAR